MAALRALVTPRSELERVLWAACAAVLLAVAWAASFGVGFVSYDTMYALVWGDALAHLRLPDLETPQAPTPHPLSIVAGALLAPLGHDAASTLMVGLATLGHGALACAAFVLGRRLFSWPVGVLFAALLLTRPFLAGATLRSLIDVPYLALVLGAAVVEAGGRRRPLVVLGILSAAGLLRPDAWLLAAAYAVYAGWRADRGERVRLAVVAASAPLVWCLFDLVSTGDPLHSLNGTQDLAAELGRTRGLGMALERTEVYMQIILRPALVPVGLAGVVVALLVAPRRVAPVAAVGLLSFGAYLAIAVAQLPVLPRYVELPAVVLALGVAVLLLGWTRPALPTGWRVAWVVVAVLPSVAVAAEVRRDVSALRGVRYFDARRVAERQLGELAQRPTVVAAYQRCRARTLVENRRVIPGLASALDVSPADFAVQSDGGAGSLPGGVRFAVLARSQAVLRLYLAADDPPARVPAAPRGLTSLAGNASWRVYASC